MDIRAVLKPRYRVFWTKLEAHNPNGIKDRPALYMAKHARERGDLKPGAMIVESTSGTLGSRLALAGISYRLPVTLVTDPGLQPIIVQILTAYGAVVDIVTEPNRSAGGTELKPKNSRTTAHARTDQRRLRMSTPHVEYTAIQNHVSHAS